MSRVRDWKLNKEVSEIPEDEKWDFCPHPFVDESFLSWFTRLAKGNFANVDLLYQKLQPISSLTNLNTRYINKQLMNLEVDQKLRNELLGKLSPFVNVPLCHFKKRKVNLSNTINKWDYLLVPLLTPRFCPYCLRDDDTPYFRYFWFLKFVTYCDIHNSLLLDTCPHCYSPIQFWNTRWDQKINTCYNCQEDLKPILITHLERHSLTFQEKFLEVITNETYNGDKIDPIYFFQQLWKVVTFESKDPKVKEIQSQNDPLSIERTFTAFYTTFKYLKFDEERLHTPYVCRKDGKKFLHLEDLESYEKVKYSLDYILNSVKDEEIKRKLEIITPLLEMGNRTKIDVENSAKQSGVSVRSIYRWITIFNNTGVGGLASKSHKRGNRSKRFPREVEQIIAVNIKAYFNQKMRIKECWEKINCDCLKLRDKGIQIPSYKTIRDRIKRFKPNKCSKSLNELGYILNFNCKN